MRRVFSRFFVFYKVPVIWDVVLGYFRNKNVKVNTSKIVGMVLSQMGTWHAAMTYQCARLGYSAATTMRA